MEKYFRTEDEFGRPVSIGASFDRSVFGDIEIEVLGLEIKATEYPVALEIGIGGTVATSPAVHNGVVYFGCCDMNFYAVDAENGRELWRFRTNDPINASPTLHDSIIYFGSFDNIFYAVSLEGKLVWKFETQGRIFSKAFVHEGAVYFGSEDKNLYALDAKTGKLKWKFKTGDAILSFPIVYDNTIYFGSNDRTFYALRLDGTLKWKFRTNAENGIFDTSVYKNMIYVIAFDKNVYALDMNTGRMIWKFALSDKPNTMVRVYKGRLYFGSRDFNLYCLDAETGRKIWSFKSGNISSWLTVDNEVVYWASFDSNLYALDARKGNLLWKFKAGSVIGHSAPAVYKNRIYFGCYDCNLYCISTKGELLWKFHTSLSHPAPFNLEERKRTLQSFEITWQPETKKIEEKYKEKAPSDFLGGYQISSRYIHESTYTTSKKRRYG